ncbi:MAG: hypothetical protein U1D30_09745 [Planctomycetota bacterium]
MHCLESCYPANVTMDLTGVLFEAQGSWDCRARESLGGGEQGSSRSSTHGNAHFRKPGSGNSTLMLSRQSMALDLPLRAAVWQDDRGSVWLGWHDIARVAAEHRVEDRSELLKKMNSALAAAAQYATSPYVHRSRTGG